jgi:hypothetical protein
MDSRAKSLLHLAATALKCAGLWLAAAVGFICKALLAGWCALALHFSNLPWPWVRTLLALVFLVFAVRTLWLRPGRRGLLWFGTGCGVVFCWWSFIQPSHERPWKPDVAVMPRAVIEGDRLRITGFRNFRYRGAEDFEPIREERVYDLSKLSHVDFFISYWKPGPVGHTFVSFDFEDAEPLCISIEVRPEIGEGFAPVGSLFKQFELIYVAGSERDIVGLRTNHRREEVYLYRTRTSPQNARRLLDHYLERMNHLADHPEFYHLLSNSCTINTVRHAWASAGLERRYDIRYLLNGLIDQVLYSEGLVDASLPFAELRSRSRINEEAAAAGERGDFPRMIREGLPTIPR